MHLVGHSFGGLVARAAAIAEPERFASLVLMSSGPAALDGPRRAMVEQLEPVLADSGLAGVYAASLAASRGTAGLGRATAGARRLPRAAVPRRRRRRCCREWAHALRNEPDRVGELAAAGVRAMVLYGAADDAWPPAVQDEMAQRLNAHRVVIPGAAHSPAVENPADTVAALDAFWRG